MPEAAGYVSADHVIKASPRMSESARDVNADHDSKVSPHMSGPAGYVSEDQPSKVLHLLKQPTPFGQYYNSYWPSGVKLNVPVCHMSDM